MAWTYLTSLIVSKHVRLSKYLFNFRQRLRPLAVSAAAMPCREGQDVLQHVPSSKWTWSLQRRLRTICARQWLVRVLAKKWTPSNDFSARRRSPTCWKIGPESDRWSTLANKTDSLFRCLPLCRRLTLLLLIAYSAPLHSNLEYCANLKKYIF